MATKTRQLADFLVAGGVSDAEIQSVPHIRPGVLQPALAGKDLSGTALGGSYVYGTAHTDGHSYYYTDIKGSKPIKDPRIGAHFGSQRHKFKSLQLLEQETATHGSNVYSVDGREWIRLVSGGSVTVQNSSTGNYINITGSTTFVEIVGYFSNANVIAQGQAGGTRRFAPYIDGGSAGTNTTQPAVNSPLEGRFVDSGMIQNLTFNSALTTPGIHTLKLLNDTNDIGIYGIELIAQDTTSTANRSKIQIPSQNVVSYGKKFSVSGTPHYDPFNGFTNSTTLHSANVDTATSLGLGTGTTYGAPWAISSSNHIRPFNGGRVVKWIASDGTIKTSVTMMPRNAQNIGTDASNEITTASATNSHTLNFSDDAIENSLSEVAKSFHWREFGNGAANLGAGGAWADFSQLGNPEDDVAYVMDDGLTSMVGNDTSSHTNSIDWYVGGADYIIITFIGTGISFEATPDAIHAGITNGVYAQNLPYGTHTLKLQRSSPYDVWVDGIQLSSAATSSGDHIGSKFITFHQPKMPPIPTDACIIADYMLMADFVAAGADELVTSKGTRLVACSRDYFYDEDTDKTMQALSINFSAITGLMIYHNAGGIGSGTQTLQLPFFGKEVSARVYDNNDGTVTFNGSAPASTADVGSNYQARQNHVASTLGLNVWKSAVTSGYWHFNSAEFSSPIHTSSHYQEFEDPLLKTLVGGDRNMEQNNLIVTPDGKTWDEVTRKTNYLGPKCYLRTIRDTAASTVNESISLWKIWRGNTGSHAGNVKLDYGNKGFAIAYDRIIVLEDGWYTIAWSMYSNQADKHPEIWVNNAIRIRGRIDPSDNLNHLEGKVYCYRGDYIYCKSDSTSAEAYYNRLFIEKEER